MSTAPLSDTALFDPGTPLGPSGNLRRRLVVSRVVEGLATLSAAIAVIALGLVVYTVVARGAGALSLDFLIKDPPPAGPGGGIRSALIGTALIVAIAAAMAAPLGVLTAIYLVEFSSPRSRSGRTLRLLLDLMQGLPTVVVGLFAFGLLVKPEHADSGFAGSVALAIVMLPLIARSSQEVLLLVPRSLREAADALGVDRWRAILTIVLPTALSGIVTSTILAVARAAGETAPLLIVDSTFAPGLTFQVFHHAVPNIPVLIFTAAEAADPNGFTRAWGAALVLLALILLANVGARVFFDATACEDGTVSASEPGPPTRPRLRIQERPVAPAPPFARPAAATSSGRTEIGRAPVFDIKDMSVHYGAKRALDWTTMKIERNLVTAVIGPSGCGKSTFIRSLNRMNDSIPGFALGGQVLYHGHDVYARATNRVEVRRRIGMVFQKPNPFPKSIYDNVAWAPRNLGLKSGLDERVERALRSAALWDEVKDRLKVSALSLSGGQQQRLCIARAVAVEPDVLLLDEPASALDPIATASIEDLIHTLKHRYTIVIVTHNMQQAARVADRTAFFSLDAQERVGTLIEYDDTSTIFSSPADTRTRDYVTGRVRLGAARPARRAAATRGRWCPARPAPAAAGHTASSRRRPCCGASRSWRTPRRCPSPRGAGSVRSHPARHRRPAAPPPA